MNELINIYELGEFIAGTMLDGIIHPDMQLSNIGRRYSDGSFAFLDFADIISRYDENNDEFLGDINIHIPEDLTPKLIDTMTKSLVPIITDLNSFEKESYFRAGFIARGGLLGNVLFSKIAQTGISGLSYANIDIPLAKIDFSFILTQHYKDVIHEWKKIPLSYRNGTYGWNENQFNINFNISDLNSFHLNILKFYRYYIKFINQNSKDSENKFHAKVLSFADLNYNNKLYCTAYGIAKKCISMKNTAESIREKCNKIIKSIDNDNLIPKHIQSIINNNIKYDLLEFLWILNDLDKLKKRD